MKSCTKCGVERPLDQFGKHKARRDGIDTFCIECRRVEGRARMAKWRAENPERAKAASRRSVQAFRKRNPNNHKERYYENLDTERERSRMAMQKSRAENPGAERERKRRYRAANLDAVQAREREKTYSRRAKQPYSPELAELMEELKLMPCSYCGVEGPGTIDHVVPLCRGGKHEAENIAPACSSCNSSKSGRLLSEWNGRNAA